MPKKPQHLSLVASTAAGYGGGTSKPKYSLTLHNSKLAPGGKHLRDGLQQRQHLKAVDGVPVSVSVDEVVGVHLKAQGSKAVAATGEASGSVTRLMGDSGGSSGGGSGSGNGSGKDGAKCGNDNELGGGVANGVMRAQNNRLWYH
ncbi:zinc finger protein ZIC 2-like [Drosophila santomea]|uniref:zinc finger protein ZIC 2-like n=1 Tax=Drosophila santomea TaxID=129105 RepID=UPI001954E767|nr:zinc finger protein ZIC 2-like [Drosophila santomea]